MEAATDGVRSATMRTLRVAFLSALSMDMIAGFGVGFVAMVLGLRLLWGELGLQTAMAVLLVAPEIFIPLRRAGAEFHASTEGQAAAGRVLEVLGTPSRCPGRPRTVRGGAAPAAAARTAADAWRSTGSACDYEHRDRPALSSFSLHVAARDAAGAHRAVGFGQVDGAGRAARASSSRARGRWRSGDRRQPARSLARVAGHFSWLPQRPHLFNATLAENLRLGRARGAADDDLRAVLDAVGLVRPRWPTCPAGSAPPSATTA